MSQWLEEFWGKLQVPSLALNILDVVIIATLFFLLFYFARRTRAFQLFVGLAIALVAMIIGSAIAGWIGLITLNWLLRTVVTMIVAVFPLVLAIIFQPELRQFFARIGQRRFPARTLIQEEALEEVCRAAETMALRKIGALVIIQRESGLAELMARGVKLETLISAEALVSIFYPGSPLHDGAAIISDGRIEAARVVVPIPETAYSPRDLGMRHLAAITVTRDSDAAALVVSEQTGKISLAYAGHLEEDLKGAELRARLNSIIVLPRKGRNGKDPKLS